MATAVAHWNQDQPASELMLSENNPKAVTDGCLSKEMLLPLYLDGKKLVTPFCCYGNDVDCDRCGAWVVFELAARQSEGTGAARIFTG